MFNKKVENEDVKLTAGTENFVNKKIRTKSLFLNLFLNDIDAIFRGRS